MESISNILPFDFTRTCKLRVGDGDDVRECMVHEGLLTASSKFFKKALRPGWKEAEEGIVYLPEEDSAIVEQYLRLLYQGHLGLPQSTSKEEQDPNPIDPLDAKCENLCDLYLFADRIQDTDAKNTIMDAIYHMCIQPIGTNQYGKGYTPTLPSIEKIYYGTPGPCLLRTFLAELHACRMERSWCEVYNISIWPREFVDDLVKAFATLFKKPTTNPFKNRFQYHEVD